MVKGRKNTDSTRGGVWKEEDENFEEKRTLSRTERGPNRFNLRLLVYPPNVLWGKISKNRPLYRR